MVASGHWIKKSFPFDQTRIRVPLPLPGFTELEIIARNGVPFRNGERRS
jgi:hypothetical protein